jgi:hypothetical protein
LIHNLFLVYFVHLYMFRAYPGPSSGGTTLCIQQLILIIFDQGCEWVLFRLEPKYTKNMLCIKLVFLYTIRKKDLDLCRSTIFTFEIIGAVREMIFFFPVSSNLNKIRYWKCSQTFLFRSRFLENRQSDSRKPYLT